ncbi:MULTISPECIES: hypothetical protein [Candidatus Brocadia]|uniref:Transcriptional regulator n=1 Tax=Candidatus Brocadia sinica JPN1 TaxID=1197129 RepID=A0ABQ0JW33_9BACT|nr:MULTISPECIES: hypothetical protein [Brocadia]NOG41331.1 hypothetical protein [Planctomycetota bacterium]GAN32822.1 putative transcriptional regulator [Candidatus Brocadia sinica JPN1]GIK13654.1 MAG: hypothetical protein BroJett002_23610 [Candidatus Brocadia sinica]GJQ16573.1 MAG: hypothetical protein HBSIN01_05320 [Candidatus Brocadia sinica]
MKLFSIEGIIELLQQLNEKQADELEGQHHDFKEWKGHGRSAKWYKV